MDTRPGARAAGRAPPGPPGEGGAAGGGGAPDNGVGGALQRVSRPGDGRAPPEFTGASGDTPRWLLPALGVVAGLTVLSSLFRESGSDALFELYPTATGQLVDQYERLYVQDGRGFLYRLMQVPPEFVGAEESGSAPTVLVLVGNLEDPSDPPLNAGMLFTLSEDGVVDPLEDADGNQYGVSMAELNRIKRERTPTLGQQRVPDLEEVLSPSLQEKISRDMARLDANPDDAEAEAAVVADGELAAALQLEAAGIDR